VEANLPILEQHGQVTFSYGPPGTDNPSAHLLVVLSNDEDAELLLWDSGDVEFNHGPFGASRFEHIEVESPGDFDELMRRFLTVLRGGS
jgi:hypothetical protein